MHDFLGSTHPKNMSHRRLSKPDIKNWKHQRDWHCYYPPVNYKVRPWLAELEDECPPIIVVFRVYANLPEGTSPPAAPVRKVQDRFLDRNLKVGTRAFGPENCGKHQNLCPNRHQSPPFRHMMNTATMLTWGKWMYIYIYLYIYLIIYIPEDWKLECAFGKK